MPNRFLDTPGAPTQQAQAPGANRFLAGRVEQQPAPPVEAEGSGISPGVVVAGGAGLAGLAALAKAPGRIGKVASGVNALRQQLMLSGLAPFKSAAGNVGAAVNQSIVRKSMDPLRQLFSRETARDFGQAFRAGEEVAPTQGVSEGVTLPLPLSLPGRLMGAADTATRKALGRAGVAADDATREVLQTPLGENFGQMGEILDSPSARYLYPFRRTPFNQWIEGLKLAKAAHEGDATARRLLGVHTAAGAVHGAVTADDPLPVSGAFGIAAAGRAGLPYGLAMLAGRRFIGGSNTGGGIVSNTIPISEYGHEQAVLDPTRPFRKPAALSALERLTGGS